MAIRTYSPSQVSLSFGGMSVEGWESIRVERDFPEFKTVHGIRGKNTRVGSDNTAATIEIELLQTSIVNEVFTAIMQLDRTNGDMRMQVLLRDILGKEVFVSDEVYLSKMAAREYTSEISTRLWTLNCLSSRENDVANELGAGSFYDISSEIFRGYTST